MEPSPIADLVAFRGRVPTFSDALLILEACRQGRLTMVNRRLTDLERREIACGDVFVFDEAVSGIKRWADGRLWSSSRMRDCFLIYIELGMAAGISGFNPRRVAPSSPADLLRKKVLSITTSSGQRLRLVAYSSAMDDDSEEPAPESNISGLTPRRDPRLASIVIPSGIFHSNTGPMASRGAIDQQPPEQVAVSNRSSSPSSMSAASARSQTQAHARSSSATVAASAGVSSPTGYEQRGHANSVPVSSGVRVRGQHGYDYANGGQYPGSSLSGSPPSSSMSASADSARRLSIANAGGHAIARRHDEHTRSADFRASPKSGVESSAWASSASGEGDYRAGPPRGPAGGYGGPGVNYPSYGHPPQHYHHHHPYYSHPTQQYQGQYDDQRLASAAHDPYMQCGPRSHHTFSPPSRPNTFPATQSAGTSTGNPISATITPPSHQADPAFPSSAPSMALTAPNNPYGDVVHHGYPYSSTFNNHAYCGRHPSAGRPRYHPHHHHTSPYYGVPMPSSPPPSAVPGVPIAYGPYPPNGNARQGDFTPAINRSAPISATTPADPPLIGSGLPRDTSRLALTAQELDARNMDVPRDLVPRADSGMYLAAPAGPAVPGGPPVFAREHRDRSWAWNAPGPSAGPYYTPVGAPATAPLHARMSSGSGGPGNSATVMVNDSLGAAIGLAVGTGSPKGTAGLMDVESTGRSPRGAAPEAVTRAGVV